MISPVERRQSKEELESLLDSVSKLRTLLIDHDGDWDGFKSSFKQYKYPFKIAYALLDSLQLPKNNTQIAEALMAKGYINQIAAERSYILFQGSHTDEIRRNREALINLPPLLHALGALPEDKYMKADSYASNQMGYFPKDAENSYFTTLLHWSSNVLTDVVKEDEGWPQRVITTSTNLTDITAELSIDTKAEIKSRYPTIIDIDRVKFIASPEAFEKFDPFIQYLEHSDWM